MATRDGEDAVVVPTFSDEEIQAEAERLHAEKCWSGCPHPVGGSWKHYAYDSLLAKARTGRTD